MIALARFPALKGSGLLGDLFGFGRNFMSRGERKGLIFKGKNFGLVT